MTSQELERQVYNFIDQGQYQNALDSINIARPGEVKLDLSHLNKLMAFVDHGLSFEEGCAIWWALPSEPFVDEHMITTVGEAAYGLHQTLLGELKTFGVDVLLGYEFKFDVAVPPTVVLALATEHARGNGVHVPNGHALDIDATSMV